MDDVRQDNAPTPTVVLTEVEARVIGVLIEKSFLTPDVYPMTTNAMVNACNQKTNRDPVVSYTAVDVDTALMSMRQRNIVRRVHLPGSRSTKHRHSLDDALSVGDEQIAILSVLMLRGPQTLGELRTRTERYVGFEDLNQVEACLESLAARSRPLVTELARQPGQKENRWMQLLVDADASPAAETVAATAPVSAPAPAPASAPAPAPTPVAPAPEVEAPVVGAPEVGGRGRQDADLVERVAELEAEITTLRRQLSSLADKLGEPLD